MQKFEGYYICENCSAYKKNPDEIFKAGNVEFCTSCIDTLNVITSQVYGIVVVKQNDNLVANFKKI